MIKYYTLLGCLLFSVSCFAQFNPQKAFSPISYLYPPNNFRAANGTPGADYWQNSADYEVKVKFDTASKKISGTVWITYTNNSPVDLSNLWLQMPQNIDKTNSRATAIAQPQAEQEDNGKGFQLYKVKIQRGAQTKEVPYLIDGTRMQIRLPEDLEAEGETIKIEIEYSYILQEASRGGRSGYVYTKNGGLYEVSYWYPRMCVFDDVNGWNTLPYLGFGEFYLDYGDIEYSITLPAGMLVTGSGILDNPEEVLTKKERKRLEKASKSDTRTFIRSAKELNEPATQEAENGWLTWKFHMNHTRDVAWAASEAFIWDAARIQLPESKDAIAMSFYPIESASDNSHGRGTEYLKGSVELFSKWFTYPYQTAINVAGIVGGMEFPGLAMNWWKSKNKSLYSLLAHEIGHTWYPMIVGSNERLYPWMDEGVNTFIDLLAQAAFNDGEYAPKRDGEYAPGGGNPAEEIVPFLKMKEIKPLMTQSDAFTKELFHPVAYFKAAFGLVLLRKVILGPERFDYAFKQYTRHWAYKHPYPEDFFRAMNNFSGEDLSWFWRGWFYENWALDQAVKSVEYIDGNPEKGAKIMIENLKKLPMPVIVEITETNGQVKRLKIPVEIWLKRAAATFEVNTTSEIKKVILDPDQVLPDVNRENNSWEE